MDQKKIEELLAAAEGLTKAGFTSFEKLPIDNPFNQFLALRR